MTDVLIRLAIAMIAFLIAMLFLDKVYTKKYDSLEIIHREPLSTAVFFGLFFIGIAHIIG